MTIGEDEKTPNVALWRVLHDMCEYASAVCYSRSRGYLRSTATLGEQESAAQLARVGCELAKVVDDLESPEFLIAPTDEMKVDVARRAKHWREEAGRLLNLCGVKL